MPFFFEGDGGDRCYRGDRNYRCYKRDSGDGGESILAEADVGNEPNTHMVVEAPNILGAHHGQFSP